MVLKSIVCVGPNGEGGEYGAGEAVEPVEGYLADGATLTPEERAFLQNNLPAKNAAIEEDIL